MAKLTAQLLLFSLKGSSKTLYIRPSIDDRVPNSLLSNKQYCPATLLVQAHDQKRSEAEGAIYICAVYTKWLSSVTYGTEKHALSS
jgi:hypothetical protein